MPRPLFPSINIAESAEFFSMLSPVIIASDLGSSCASVMVSGCGLVGVGFCPRMRFQTGKIALVTMLLVIYISQQ